MRKIANLNRFSMLKDYKFSVEHILVQTIRNKTGQCPVAHHPVLRLRLVQTNFIPEITSLLLLLIGRLDFTPCGGKFTSSTDMPFSGGCHGSASDGSHRGIRLQFGSSIRRLVAQLYPCRYRTASLKWFQHQRSGLR